MRATTLGIQFEKAIPRPMAEGVLYVSMEYATAGHKCCCGCGNDVFTRLAPTDWTLTYDGRTISLRPSIGNWGFACQSHYWIRNNRVIWAEKLSPERVAALKEEELIAPSSDQPPKSRWTRFTNWLRN